jgi:hypothetical protein
VTPDLAQLLGALAAADVYVILVGGVAGTKHVRQS